MNKSMNEIEAELIEIPLHFETQTHIDVFKSKNNKTLKETMQSKRYDSLAERITKNYFQDLDTNLGDFLFQLKNAGDEFYKKFLNKYGDLEYSLFSLKNEKHQTLKGVYFYYLNDELKYVLNFRT